MKTKLNKAYMTEILEMLLRTPSPTGYTHHIMQKVEQEVSKLGFELSYTNKGCGIVTIPGTSSRSCHWHFCACGYTWCYGAFD